MAEETIYNSIHTGEQIDSAVAWLLKHAQDHICGGAAPGTTIETPSDPTYWFAGAGTYVCGSSTISIPDGRIGIISYDGSDWSSVTFDVGKSTVYLDSMGEELDGTPVHIDPGMVIYDPDQSTIKKCTAPDVYETIGCNENVLYCNKVTNILYRWQPSALNMVQVGGGGGGVLYTEDSTTIYVTAGGYIDTTPRISAQPTEINLSPSVGSTATKTIVIKGYNLTSPIAIALSDASGYYSIDKQTLPAEGGNVVLTYHPTAAGTHSASLLITSGNDADVAVGVKGIAATPTISVDKQSLSLKGESGTPVTASFHVTGVSLTDVINVAVNGNGFTVSPNLITINQAVNGSDVVVTFDGSADSGNATITLTSTGATSVQVIAEYMAIGRLAVGDTITSYPGFVFTVLDGQETVSVKGSGASGDVVIPSSVLDSNGLSYDVTTMDYKAFFGMSGITSVDVPSSIVMWLGGEGGYKGYSQAFFNCSKLVSATLSFKGETRTDVFTNCSSLRNVTLRDDSDTIPGNCFMNCSALESLVIPDNVTSIGNSAFNRCGIKRIQIGTSDKCKCDTFGSAFFAGSTNGAMSLEYIICYSHSIPSAALYSQFAYGGGLPYGFRNYDSSNNAKGTNLDTNGSGRVYVPRSVLNDYRTNPTDGINSNANVFLRVNNLNDSTGASGRIYAIEDIGTISGHENDALLTD